MAHKTPTTGDYRKFGLFLAALFLLVGLFPLWRGGEARWWAALIGGALGLVSLAFPIAIQPLFKVSLKLGGVLGWINTRILLGAMFYLVVTPVGLALRIARGRNPGWAKRADQSSYWHAREKVDLPKQMRHIF
jgi:multisubunit Na+/H+ antiporter MnhG subunit